MNDIQNSEVFKKYFRNINIGKKTIEQNELQEFKGFSIDYQNGISYRVFLKDKDNKRIKNMVINPITELTEECGIKLYTSQTSWRPHIVLAGLICNTATGSKQEKIFGQLINEKIIKEASQRFIDQEIIFDTLWGGNAITMAASHIPESVLEFRRKIAGLGLKMGMKKHDVTNILHTTIARISNNSNVSIDAMKYFANGIMQVHKSLVESPLRVTIDNTEFMPNREFMGKYERGLPQNN